MEKKIGFVDVIANFGREFHQSGSDTWLYSVAVKYIEVKGLYVLAELFGSADNGFKNADTVCNIGFRKDVSENYTAMASLGRSLRDGPDHPTLLSYVGIQKRF